MPLSPPAEREPIHHRRIDCRGYRRADGLWDLEGHLTDTKSYAFHNASRGEVGPGEPVHDMWVRLTIDDDLLIHAAEAATDASPYPETCPQVTPDFAALAGKRIGPGWKAVVREQFGGIQGCTHLSEILGRLGTVAFQTIFPLKERRAARPSDRPPRILNTCHALDTRSPVVRRHWPQWYTGSDAAE